MKHIHLQFKRSKKKKIRLADPAENFVKVFNEIKNANRKRYDFKTYKHDSIIHEL